MSGSSDEALGIFGDGGCRIDHGRAWSDPPCVVRRHPHGQPSWYAARATPGSHRPGPGRVSFCNFDRHHGQRPADGRAPRTSAAGRRRDLPPGRRARQHRHVRAGPASHRPATGDCRAARHRRRCTTRQVVGTGRRRRGRCARSSRWRRRSSATRAPARNIVGLASVGQPLKLPRDATRSSWMRPPRHALRVSLDGDVRRLLAGDARRDLRATQRRGARRHHALIAHGAGAPVDYGSRRRHGPSSGGGQRRLARARPVQRRHGADGAPLPDPELRRRVVGGFEAR